MRAPPQRGPCCNGPSGAPPFLLRFFVCLLFVSPLRCIGSVLLASEELRRGPLLWGGPGGAPQETLSLIRGPPSYRPGFLGCSTTRLLASSSSNSSSSNESNSSNKNTISSSSSNNNNNSNNNNSNNNNKKGRKAPCVLTLAESAQEKLKVSQKPAAAAAAADGKVSGVFAAIWG